MLLSVLILSAAWVALAAPAIRPNHQLLHEFPNGTWVENVVVRSNGQLLVTTLFPSAAVYQIDTRHGSSSPARLVAHIPSALGCSGITEVNPTTYAFISMNVTATEETSTANSSSIWRLSFENSRPDAIASVAKLADVPSGQFLNGMQALPSKPGTILIADSGPGAIYTLDTFKPHPQPVTVQQSPELEITNLSGVPIGINGLRIIPGAGKGRDTLVFTNSNQQTLYSVPLAEDASAAGPYSTLATFPTFIDDFTLLPGKAGEFSGALVCTDPGNSLDRVTPEGKVTIALGGGEKALVAGVTSAQVGKAPNGGPWKLYMVTNGGLAGKENGGTVGGKVLEFDLE